MKKNLKTILFSLFLLCTLTTIAQINIRGTVIGDGDETLPGVSVMVKGTTTGTVTDVDGNYSLSVPNGSATLQFSYVGFVSQETVVGSRTVVNIKLIEDAQSLEEVIVVGYGVQRKSDVTGSITKVDADDFKNLPVTSVEMAFQGRAAGVMIMSQSGAPGAGTAVRIRGVGTVNNANDPLYVVDGIPVRDIDYLNPTDISSMEILKDASATAIYGSRASNGVVLITTTRGNAEGEWKTEIKVDTYYGISNALNLPEMEGVSGYLMGKRLAYRNNMTSYPVEFLDEEAFKNATAIVTGSREGTNWVKEVFRTGSVQNLNVNIKGGNRKFSYMTSAGYMKDEGTIVFSDFTRFTLRANVDFNISERVKLTTNMSVTNSSRHTISENNLDQGVVFAVFTYDPTGPVYRKNYEQVLDFPGMGDRMTGYDPDNYYSTFGTGKYTNTVQPYFSALRSGKLSNDGTLRLVGNAMLDIKIFPWLIYKTNLGTDRAIRNQDSFMPKYYIDPFEKSDVSYYTNSNSNNNNWTFENTISFNRKFGDHSVSAVAGVTLESWQSKSFNARRDGYDNPDEYQWVLNAGTGTQTNGGSYSSRAMMSYLGRINYSFADRYLLTVSVRADGSSRFVKEYRWASFPSFSLGWRVSEEKFFKNLDQNVLSSLKLRAGWGQIGNQMGVGNNDYLSTITQTNAKRYIFGQSKTQYTGYSLQTMGNPVIQWETSTQTNFGIDFGLFANKISGSIEYYIKNTGDMPADDTWKGGESDNDRPFVNHLIYYVPLPENQDLWNWYSWNYVGIQRTNILLEKLPDIPFPDEVLKKQYSGEARVLRAFFYLSLVRVFGGVPLLEKMAIPGELQPRATSAEIHQFLRRELNEAANELPSRCSQNMSQEWGRVCKETSLALLAKTELYFGSFAEARDAAKKVIDSGCFALEPQFGDLFFNNNLISKESIFERLHANTNGLGDDIIIPTYFRSRMVGGWGFLCPTQDLVNEFEVGDPRILYTITETGDIFPHTTAASRQEVQNHTGYSAGDGYHSRKHFYPQPRRATRDNMDKNDKLIRYADVLLMYAEALAETGGSLSEACSYINMVRERARKTHKYDPEAFGDTPEEKKASRVRQIADVDIPDVSASSLDEFRVHLRHERRVELACEANRVYDLKRWGWEYMKPRLEKSRQTLRPGWTVPEPANLKLMTFPIPQQEIDRTDRVVEQNPGW